LNHRCRSEDLREGGFFYAFILERMMAKAARSPVLLSTPAASTERSARDRSAADIFMSVMFFSLAGLLVSLVALMLGLPQVWD
jgi:hypothetical protein